MHMSDLHVTREPHVGDHVTAAEAMYFATQNQARTHLFHDAPETANALYAQHGNDLIEAIVKWRGAQLAAGNLYVKDAEGKVTGLAALPLKEITAALDAKKLGGFRAAIAASQVDDVSAQVGARGGK
jgi:hypothetical protein